MRQAKDAVGKIGCVFCNGNADDLFIATGRNRTEQKACIGPAGTDGANDRIKDNACFFFLCENLRKSCVIPESADPVGCADRCV